MIARPRSHRADHGAAAVEMAIVLPLLLLIVFGIIEFGLGWNRQLNLTEAAHQGARVAALSGDPDEVDRTIARILGPDTSTQLDRRITTSCDDGDYATVDLTLTWDSPTGLGSLMATFGRRDVTNFTLHATGVMPCVG
ncbi:TadE/TadG family type IV pilus assembly protein [Actinoplanes sp. NPDC051494]|uniref:TadE/TadG family type IV pilus assembly protein n=1 Tax=Actinoplanes sp. NPDC051494 TaxID=3363907 RepID=UPI0037923467